MTRLRSGTAGRDKSSKELLFPDKDDEKRGSVYCKLPSSRADTTVSSILNKKDLSWMLYKLHPHYPVRQLSKPQQISLAVTAVVEENSKALKYVRI